MYFLIYYRDVALAQLLVGQKSVLFFLGGGGGGGRSVATKDSTTITLSAFFLHLLFPFLFGFVLLGKSLTA